MNFMKIFAKTMSLVKSLDQSLRCLQSQGLCLPFCAGFMQDKKIISLLLGVDPGVVMETVVAVGVVC